MPKRRLVGIQIQCVDNGSSGSPMKAITVSGLDAGFFIGTDYAVIWSKSFSVPEALIKIQDTGGFLGKVWIA
jgi:hypothetical protein